MLFDSVIGVINNQAKISFIIIRTRYNPLDNYSHYQYTQHFLNKIFWDNKKSKMLNLINFTNNIQRLSNILHYHIVIPQKLEYFMIMACHYYIKKTKRRKNWKLWIEKGRENYTIFCKFIENMIRFDHKSKLFKRFTLHLRNQT